MGWERGAIWVSISLYNIWNPAGWGGINGTCALISNCSHSPLCQHLITPFFHSLSAELRYKVIKVLCKHLTKLWKSSHGDGKLKYRKIKLKKQCECSILQIGRPKKVTAVPRSIQPANGRSRRRTHHPGGWVPLHGSLHCKEDGDTETYSKLNFIRYYGFLMGTLQKWKSIFNLN